MSGSMLRFDQPIHILRRFALAGLGCVLLASVPSAYAGVEITNAPSYSGDCFEGYFGLGSPTPTKTAYVYVTYTDPNGNQSGPNQIASATNASDMSQWWNYYAGDPGDYDFQYWYSDSNNGGDPNYVCDVGTYHLDAPPPSVSNDSATGTVTGNFGYYINGNNNPTSYDASNLPPGLSVDNSSGYISGVPTTVGTWTCPISASNDTGTGSATLTIRINPAVPPSIVVQPTSQSPSTIRALATGDNFTIGLMQDGAVWALGYNGFGQLGDGTTDWHFTPSPVIGVPGALAVAGGGNHALFLANNGVVWSCGYNGYGQLGDGTTTDRHAPVTVSGLSGVVAIAAGEQHSLALKSDGTVWSWGYNGNAALGDGTYTSRLIPVRVANLTGVVAIAAGEYNSYAIRNDGTLWAWGANGYGQLGDGTTTTRTAPIQVLGLSNVKAVAAGYSYAVAVKSDGTVWSWGCNWNGQLGDGTTNQRNTPYQLGGFSTATSVACGSGHTLVRTNDGSVWACGYNSWGQIGDGTTYQRNSMVRVVGLSSAASVSAGWGFSMGLKSDGTVWGWGYNSYGNIGDGTGSYRLTPTQAIGLSDCAFTVLATADPAPTYQWQRKPAGQTAFSNLTNTSTYSGATTAALHVVAPSSVMNGDQFRCIVTNTVGTVTTTATTLVLGVPTLSIVGGNNQGGLPSQFNSQPFDVAVWNAAGVQPLIGTSVTFTVQSGGGLLATTNTGSPNLVSSLTLTTDLDGTAQAYYQQPGSVGITSQILASSGGGQVTFTTQSVATLPTPSAPPGLHTGATAPGSITFSWGASTPSGSPLAGYYVFRNGVQLNGQPLIGTTYTDTGVSGGTTYTYTVKAVDTSGAQSVAATLNVTAPAYSTSGSFDVFTPTP
jgi:alpha-tubulin suppressor-like RCC1 family protein